MDKLAATIDALNARVGRMASWLLIVMVVAQLAIVLARYVFGVGSVWLQEAVVYMHGSLFLLAAAFTLQCDRHVRVDLFYRAAGIRAKALVDLCGTVALLAPMCAVILWFSWPYVYQSWSILEGSRESSGIQALFLLKTMILLFALQLALQGFSLAVRSLRALRSAAAETRRGPLA